MIRLIDVDWCSQGLKWFTSVLWYFVLRALINNNVCLDIDFSMFWYLSAFLESINHAIYTRIFLIPLLIIVLVLHLEIIVVNVFFV